MRQALCNWFSVIDPNSRLRAHGFCSDKKGLTDAVICCVESETKSKLSGLIIHTLSDFKMKPKKAHF